MNTLVIQQQELIVRIISIIDGDKYFRYAIFSKDAQKRAREIRDLIA